MKYLLFPIKSFFQTLVFLNALMVILFVVAPFYLLGFRDKADSIADMNQDWAERMFMEIKFWGL